MDKAWCYINDIDLSMVRKSNKENTMEQKLTPGLVKPVQARLTPENNQWLEERKQAEDRSANWVINNVFDQARARAQQTQGAVR